ncbi:conserved Plasmodium protein, unknown function [Plasmodium berghei]|uniref:BCNT-C domain-containing protein n=2 Tax=Plasmodium berghei TaxID=5821 RepID=A0A509ANM6_PLABA|nr:conserved protein, unknown function [Plasmodium berghei ANKA]CXI60109.1 conserved Plasmodium protein, unknown function [Plasmodium berghei]SCM23533.1 conserved Plasmodium protein, unknown function [Plasmodium berghei]SCN26638.1 conserved Plasmodium protein, unknown function [Plasmodium berghei]SCO60905.1 conserved Plasmodium protein, unknown function [Plasmodium berghei]SCO62927.1 conserved Plasmodium protein, unknown function [Plasmodium berghei]|eukprot:XP_034422261.1 conserved protein, unknown function [Plasmodium berghei ANKA]
MATILNMDFPSSDENDEDYNAEEDLKEELKEQKKKKKNSKKIGNNIKKSIIKEKTEKIYTDINKEYEKLYTHETNVTNEDFLLQFHKKYPQFEKNNNTTQKLFNHLNKYCSIEQDNSNFMDIKDYKKICRSCYDNNNNNNDVSKVVKNALNSFYSNNSVYVEKKYMYAGKIYNIKKKIDKTSSSYKRYLKTKDKINIGGNFANIDELVQQIQESKQINTIDKSTEDWKHYKIANSIDEEKLKANQNYLENKFFAENVERKMFENKAKRKP